LSAVTLLVIVVVVRGGGDRAWYGEGLVRI